MGWLVECDGKWVDMPFTAPGDLSDWMVPTLSGRFPNRVMLWMDETRFDRAFKAHAIRTSGVGEFATLAYCGAGLTIERHKSLKSATRAKQAI
jgi:hypothetical protein